MIEVIILENTQGVFAVNYELLFTSILGFLSALVIWLIKLSIDTFIKEGVALNEIQVALAVNAEKMKDNEDFYKQWLLALEQNRLYFVQFHSFMFPYDKLKDIGSSKLLNQIVATFYMCESFGKDLSGMHKSYYDIGTSGVFKDHSDEDWLAFNQNTHDGVLKSAVSFNTIRNKILEDVASIKSYIEIRKQSFYYRLISTFKSKAVSKFENY